jgi:hypothetical protein
MSTGSGTTGANRRRRSRSSRRKGSVRPFWGDPETAAGPEHVIEPVEHPTALIDSLGAPPFPRADAAPHYFTAVYSRATGMALALAHAYGIVDEVDEGDEVDDDDNGSDGRETSDT